MLAPSKSYFKNLKIYIIKLCRRRLFLILLSSFPHFLGYSCYTKIQHSSPFLFVFAGFKYSGDVFGCYFIMLYLLPWLAFYLAVSVSWWRSIPPFLIFCVISHAETCLSYSYTNVCLVIRYYMSQIQYLARSFTNFYVSPFSLYVYCMGEVEKKGVCTLKALPFTYTYLLIRICREDRQCSIDSKEMLIYFANNSFHQIHSFFFHFTFSVFAFWLNENRRFKWQ